MRRNKKKYKGGGFKLEQMGGLASFAGQAIGANTNPTDQGGSFLSGALQGGGAGAALGPVGAGIGALIGGISGIFNANEAAELAKRERQQASFQEQSNALRQPAKKKGGKLLSNRLNVVKGGSLTPVSDDAVQVVANDPSQTDSVELRDAFVDHDEIIDNQNRVFSDELKTPSGRSIAKEAKKLEKMKGGGRRFQGVNDHIENKLDQLFEYQEDMKKKKKHNLNNFTNTEPNPDFPDEMANLKGGGTIHIKKANRGKFTASAKKAGQSVQQHAKSVLANPHASALQKKRANFARNAAKWHHALGGEVDPNKVKVSADPMMAQTGEDQSLPTSPRASIDEQLRKNYPGMDLNILDSTNKPIVPGTPDTHDQYVLRRAYRPTLTGGSNKLYGDMLDPKTGQPIAKNGFKKGGRKPKYGLGTPNLDFLTKGKQLAQGEGYAMGEYAPFGNTGSKMQNDLSLDPVNNNPVNEVPALAGKSIAIPKSSTPVDWQKIGTTAATFAPNLLNSQLQGRLAAPPSPAQETYTKLDRVNPAAQLAAIDSATRQANELGVRNTAQSGSLGSYFGNNLSKKLMAKNDVWGKTSQLNAGIQGNEAYINALKQSRNVERTNLKKMQDVEFNNKRLELSSSNISNLASKILMRGKEKNMMALDRDKYKILMGQYQNLPPLMKEKYPDVFSYYASDDYKNSQKFGGKIKKSGDLTSLRKGGLLKRYMKNC